MLSSHPPPAAASASSSSSTSSSPVSALLPSSSTTISAVNHSSRSSRKDEIICQVALDCPSDFLQCADPPIDGIGLLNNGTLTKSLLSPNVPKTWKSALDCVQCVEAFHTDTMNHCVPEWDATGRDLDVMWDPTELFSLSKVKWDSGQTRRPDLAFVPDHDFEELCWQDGQLLVMQGLSGKSILKNRSCWPVSAGEAAPSASGLPAAGMDSTFYTLGTGESMDPSTVNMHTQEDELLSWLQNPFDELADKLEIPGDATNSNAPSTGCERLCPGDLIHHGIPQNTVNADDSGSGPTSKNLRHETLLPFQTTMLPKPGHDYGDMNQHIYVNALMGSNITPTTIMTSKEQFEHGPMMARLEMLPPQMHPAIVGATRSLSVPSESTTSMNFSNFSRPAAAFKANLHSIGMASGPSGLERLKQLDRVAVDSESIDSRTKHFKLIGPRREGDALPAVSECVGASVVHHPAQSFSLGREAEQDVPANGAVNGSSGMVGKSYGWNSSVISSTAPGTDRSTEVLEVAELSDTSSSGGSEESDGDDGKGAAGVGKRKVYDEGSEVQSRTLENEAAGTNKHATGGGNHMKRSRAAENHNQSERRRRDRISEKMKALQALVPNSHKTDKASMLEEAIAYIKALKGHIQMMSYRSRMCFSPMLIPQGMQHVQMGAWPHMGVGVGMGMGMGMGAGMGMLEMTMGGAATTARQFPPLLSIPGAAMPTVHAIPSATLDSARPVHGVVKHLVSPPAHQILPARPGNPAAGTHDFSPTPNVVPHKLFPASQHQPVQCTSPQIVSTKVYGNGVPHAHQRRQPTTFMAGTGPLQQQ